ncbi:MAG: 3-oxoacyl-[Roseburia sp.]|nr:3-oxoacyl-[acyl-carrier-protein] reductase [Roseburia sp.]
MENRKTAIVTGGSRGIGRAICVRLAKMGMNVIFNYNAGEEAAQETLKLCKEQGVEAYALKADVSNEDASASFVAEALELSGGRMDVLVNNAGITRDGLIMKMSEKDFDDVLNVNLKGCFHMSKAAAKVMLKQRSGKIINISSVVGVVGNAGQTNYAASKAGVIGFSKSLAKELASRKINVNVIAPGMIETDMTGVLSDTVKEKMLEAIPFHEMGKPEDIANAVAFLAGEESNYITGQVLCVDGGMVI